MERAHGSVRPNDAMVVDESAACAERFEDDVFGVFEIVLVNTFEERFESALKLSGIKAINAVEFVGPCYGIGTDIPFETADVSYTLRLLQALQHGPEVAFHASLTSRV